MTMTDEHLIEATFDLGSAQDLIDSGLAWRLEGHVGRQCAAAVEAGEAILGPVAHLDYYGNTIPAWWMIHEGHPGSPEYAIATSDGEFDREIPGGYDTWTEAREAAIAEWRSEHDDE